MADTTYTVEPDGHGDATLWRHQTDERPDPVAVTWETDPEVFRAAAAVLVRPDEATVERLAPAVHDAYLATCERLGWPVKPDNQVPYGELSDDSQELDRATVRAVLAALKEQATGGESDD